MNFIDPQSISQVGDSCNKNDLAAALAARTHVDVAGNDGDVLEVQRGIDLVHEVERRGLVVVQREHQRQGAERLLPSGQVEDLLPALLGRAHAVQRRVQAGRMRHAHARTHKKVGRRGGGCWYLNMMPSEKGSRLSTSSSSASPPSVSIW